MRRTPSKGDKRREEVSEKRLRSLNAGRGYGRNREEASKNFMKEIQAGGQSAEKGKRGGGTSKNSTKKCIGENKRKARLKEL